MYNKTDTLELISTVALFWEKLPGWWFTIGSCELTRHASCGPELDGLDGFLLKSPSYWRIFDSFDCDDPNGTLSSSLLNVINMALEAKEKYMKLVLEEKANQNISDTVL